MRALEPFFLLVGRPALFWLGLLAMASISIVFAAVTQPHAPTAAHIAPGFLAILIYPAACGSLVGAILKEFQHTTVAWPEDSCPARRKVPVSRLVSARPKGRRAHAL